MDHGFLDNIFFASLLHLSGRLLFLITQLSIISMSTRSSLLDDNNSPCSFMSTAQHWDSCCLQMNVFALLLSQQIAPICLKNWILRKKELTLISWERNVFLPSCMLSSRHDLPRSGFWVGWVGWKICLSSNFSFWLSSNFRTQVSFPLVFQWDL